MSTSETSRKALRCLDWDGPTTLEKVDRDLRGIASLIEPLAEQERELQELRRRLVSLTWIEENDVRRWDVTPSEPALNLGEFITWAIEEDRLFSEWDGAVYRTSDLAAAYSLERLESCRLEDLP